VTFEIVSYDGIKGWGDCGEVNACKSISFGKMLPSGSEITDLDDHCTMRVIFPN